MWGRRLAAAGGGLCLVAGVGLLGVSQQAQARLAQSFEVPDVDIPVPWPVPAPAGDGAETAPDGEAAEARDASAEAIARGRHLLAARYPCLECHGADGGGGRMVDDPMLGTWLGPNLTLGEGSVTRDYTMSDWNRIVRHGVKPDGSPAVMPSIDFLAMTDQELSDIVAALRALPPVDRPSPPPTYGPLGTVLLAAGEIVLIAEELDHTAPHAAEPPQASVSPTFGAHLARVCTGCHGPQLRGGKVRGGDPSWPPASNLTLHADGLAGWTRDDFVTAMRTATRPDGTKLRSPMSDIVGMANAMTEQEMDAMWSYLTSLPAAPSPKP
jgi:mono/diheme cytochrome c family protein